MWVWYPQEEVQLSMRAKLKAFHQYPSLLTFQKQLELRASKTYESS